MSVDTSQAKLRDRIHDELVDSVDEELELEIDDERLSTLLDGGGATPHGMDRLKYFGELLRLQKELVKLQDWMVHRKLKVVVLFEGRDAAGKGGVIKRVTQRLNPRSCKVVRCRRRPSASAPSGTSSATCRTCRQAAKWCCSTAAGTTAPASSG
jgi:polyphosphate kinase 2 (PPK2 family)